MDIYDFAWGLAVILDRDSGMGLRRIVEDRQQKLRRISDPHRPYRTLMHLIIDTVQPEHVPQVMPKGLVTVREAARILTDMASHSRLTPQGAPVVIDRNMHLFVFKAIFQYFLQLLILERYDEQQESHGAEEATEVPRVDFMGDGVVFNQAAHRRWTAVIGQPAHFEIVADFLRTVRPDEYGSWYFRIMQAVVSLDGTPEEDELRQAILRLRSPRVVN